MQKIYLNIIEWKISCSPSLKSELEKLSDGYYIINIDKQKKVRSPQQNAFYWGVFLPALTDTGYTADELHELFKKKFLAKRKVLTKLGRKVIWKYKSTTELSTVEFEEYLQKIRDFVRPFGYILPFPHDNFLYDY